MFVFPLQGVMDVIPMFHLLRIGGRLLYIPWILKIAGRGLHVLLQLLLIPRFVVMAYFRLDLVVRTALY